MTISTLRSCLFLIVGLLAGSVQAQRLAAGNDYSLSIHPDGTLWAWGRNTYGQLGTGDLVYHPTPVQIGTATNWKGVAAGATCVVAVRTDGTLWTWGMRNADPFTPVTASQKSPTQLGTATNWQSVAANDNYSLAIRTDGTLWAWGVNRNGQFGNGDTDAFNPRYLPGQVGTATNWRSVAAGYQHVLAVRTDGTLWGWGDNYYGQFGTGATSADLTKTPIQLGSATNWQSVAAGTGFSLGLRTDGTLWGWGVNYNGQLGVGNKLNQLTPVQVGTSTDTWQSVSAGGEHAAAIRRDGTLWTWGRNTYGQLGEGTTTSQLVPTQVGTLAGWQEALAGPLHTLAIRTDGALWAWGQNLYGQLGNGDGLQLVPGQVGTATSWRSVAAGLSHSLAIRADGTLWAWGRNGSGQLGLGNVLDQPVPVQVGTATTWQTVVTSGNHTLALRTDGSLWAWGYNRYGQLGYSPADYSTPGRVSTATWKSVAAGETFTVAVRSDGTLWAWGENFNGQLGLGTASSTVFQKTPAQVGTGTTWQQVAAGRNSAAAIRADGTLWTWGDNNVSQLGFTGDDRYVPTQVGTATTWQNVVIGNNFMLARRADGTLWSWGLSNNGELGNGSVSSTMQPIPRQAGTVTTWQTLAAGYADGAAIRTDGTLWTWGGNTNGQLGDGTTARQAIPTQIGSAATWLGIAAGQQHMLAIRADGTLWSWGLNEYGQLGYGSPINSRPLYIANGGGVLAAAAPASTAGWGLAPNPAHSSVQLLGLPAGPVVVHIFDAQGRLVSTGSTTTVATAGLAPGLYLVRASAGGTTRTLRLVVK